MVQQSVDSLGNHQVSALTNGGEVIGKPPGLRDVIISNNGNVFGYTQSQLEPDTDQFPDWPLVQVAFCDLTADDLDEQLDRLQTLPSVRGIRQIIGRAPGEDTLTGTNGLLEDPKFLAGLKKLGSRGLSFDLQLLPELMDQSAGVLAQAPETRIALCHAGSPHDRTSQGLQRWADALTALSDLPQVYCKLSGLGMFDHSWSAESASPIISTCLSQFGANRCMFGSNFPVDSLTSTYKEVVSRHREIIPTSNQEGVFRGTSKRFYRIE